MSQINSDETRKRAELLKIAKQILIQDYDAMRGTNHQQWLRESQIAWKTKGILIGYPTAKLFPTEQEVVSKALELYNNLHQPVETVSNTPVTPPASIPITTAAQVTEYREPVSYADSITPSITAQLQAAYNSPTTYSIVTTNETIQPTEDLPTTTAIVQAAGDFVIIEEPIELSDTSPAVEEPVIEESIEASPVKHSLLRSVLSGWLAKEKDKP